MATIQWRPEVNSMAIPQSYLVRFVPRNVANRQDIAADIAKRLPDLDQDVIERVLRIGDEAIQERLLHGEQVTMEGSFTYAVSFACTLDDPNDPVPELEDHLEVSVQAEASCIETLRQGAQLQRLPMLRKLPAIHTVEDTLLKLPDVLTPGGVLQLNGENLLFDPEGGFGECVIEGTESGRAIQTHFPMISNSAIMVMPEVPDQANPWNNEYIISVRTHYSGYGDLRSGIYPRILRTPLMVPGLGGPCPPHNGILSGSHAAPYVEVHAATLTANERLRIQVIQDMAENRLRFNLLGMKEDGPVGPEVLVIQNGRYLLPGFSDSKVTSLEITVHDYPGLWEMIRNHYSGRLVDILDLRL